METVKIVRINGEYLDNEINCSEYITPYTGYDHIHWFLFDEGKTLFDKLGFECLTKQQKGLLPEYRMTKSQLEANVVEHFEEGDMPHLYLFSFEIPKHIWDNREIFAEDGGYSDAMDYINDYTNYHWKLEIDRVIVVPKNILKKHHYIAA